MKQTDWDKHYSRIAPIQKQEPEPAHWGWRALGMVLAMLMLAWLGAWIAQGLAA